MSHRDRVALSDAVRMTTDHSPTIPTGRDKRIIVRVAGPLRDVIEAAADADGRTVSSMVRRVLIQWASDRIANRTSAAA
jgi:uncharacterized protein (DUF1778 family)